MADERETVPLATGGLAGVYQYQVAEDAWWWSDEVFALHGLNRDGTVPTTELLLEHQHPEDRAHAREMIEECLAGGHPFRSYHRIVTTRGKVRRVVITGDGRLDPEGRVTT